MIRSIIHIGYSNAIKKRRNIMAKMGLAIYSLNVFNEHAISGEGFVYNCEGIYGKQKE